MSRKPLRNRWMIRADALNRQAAIARVSERGRALSIGHSHPGYLIGIHWLAAAYERICAGEPEAEVMSDYGYLAAPRVSVRSR